MTDVAVLPDVAAPASFQTVEVHFKGNRRAFFTWHLPEDPLHLREAVIVEAGRGLDFGRVSKVGEHAEKACAGSCTGCAVGAARAPEAPRTVVRRAAPAEIATANDLRRQEEEVRRKTIERVRGQNLEMRISDAEWQWDRSRLTLYFTAEKRVDFRNLVRDLAGMFRTRIELRQIGVRDEAARLTGVGRCGREYCCSTWLKELSPVSLALAKDQHLSLNPTQISGGCGRLLCCLKYEHEFYAAARRRFPKEGKSVRTSRGAEKVIAVDIFRERVFLRAEDQASRVLALVDLKEEMEQAGAALQEQPPRPAAPIRQPRPERSDAPASRRPPPPKGAAPPAAEPPAAGEAALPEGGDARKSRRNRRRRRGRRPGSGPAQGGPAGPASPEG
jgi:cell fate regulator YaaT (PSP1 superfamily)